MTLQHTAGNNGALSQCPALILVGGLGTRLRTAYADGPKVLAPVRGRPFLAYLLNMLADQGLSRVVLCVGYRAKQIEQWLAQQNFGLDIVCSHEEEVMGTAGALGLAYSRHARGERVLAMNGDSILELSLCSMWNLHMARGAEATIVLARVPDTSRYGSVEVNEGGWVTSFSEKRAEGGPGLINGGVYLFEPSVMEQVVGERKVSLEREVLPDQLTRGLLAFKSDGYFLDIGVPQDFVRAQSELKAVVEP